MTWYLETERLKLRAIDSTDARNLYELNADPRVMEFLSPEYDTLEEAEAILPKVVARNERYGNQLGLFAAIEKGREEFIGTFILRPDRHAPDDTRNLEIGYRLKQCWWGKGLGTEGSLALVERDASPNSAHAASTPTRCPEIGPRSASWRRSGSALRRPTRRSTTAARPSSS